MSKRPRFCFLALSALLVLAACRKDPDLMALEDGLHERYGEAYVTAPDSTAANLVVWFPASPFAERPDSVRRATARKVAEYVRDQYPAYKTVRKVTVEFMSDKETKGDAKHVAASYTFTRDELGAPAS